MATVRFTQNIQRHVECPEEVVDGMTLREVLDAYFARHAGARGYVVDEHGELRRHMVVFVDGKASSDRRALSDPVGPASDVFVFQAL